MDNGENRIERIKWKKKRWKERGKIEGRKIGNRGEK